MKDALQQNLKLIYDFGDSSPRYIYLLFVLPFFIAGLIMMYTAVKHTKPGQPDKKQLGKRFVIGLIFVVMTVFAAVMVLNTKDFSDVEKNYKIHNFKTTEGNVHEFLHESFPNGSRRYSFYVNGVYFQIHNKDFTHYGCTSNDIKDFEDNTGIKLANNTFLKVSYYSAQGQNWILRLEIKADA